MDAFFAVAMPFDEILRPLWSGPHPIILRTLPPAKPKLIRSGIVAGSPHDIALPGEWIESCIGLDEIWKPVFIRIGIRPPDAGLESGVVDAGVSEGAPQP